MNHKVTVHKLDADGNEIWSYEGVELERSNSFVVLEAFFDRDDQDFYGMTLRHGDRFKEIHYSDKWYSIYRIFDVETNAFKGWYCNLSRPARFEANHIFSEDLELDLLVFPERRWILLDQEEFDRLDLPDVERERVNSALDEIKRHIEARVGFFTDP